MGVYKVIQDIEAEDKLLGPLTLKQFIFAIIALLFYYLSFLVVSKGGAFFLIIFLPPALIATFFAWPRSSDQPTEVWALAKIRFFFKPRKRVWDQSGIKELVTITAPKKVAEPMRSNGLSQGEVNSRLGALASTIDSRGWAIKNVNINLSAQPTAYGVNNDSDRLVTASSFPQEVPSYEIQASDDIMDEENNPIAQQFDQMISASTQAHRQQLLDMMSQPQLTLPTPQATAAPLSEPAKPERSKLWFLGRPEVGKRQRKQSGMDSTSPVGGMVAAAVPTAEEEALGQQLKAEHTKPDNFSARMKTIQPLIQPADDTTAADDTADLSLPEPVDTPAVQPQAVQPDPAILQLATNNDLNVATLARQANKQSSSRKGDLNDNEVVISLH